MAASDTTKPVLTSLSFASAVDVTNGGQNITFTAGATDVGLGVSNVNVRFKQSWQGQYGNDNFVSIGQSYGDNFDDGKAVEYEFVDSTSGAGTYEIDYVSVYDKAGNSRFYYTSELVGLGFQTKFDVISNAKTDTTKPVLTSLSFASAVDVTNGGQNITFTAGATDVGLGVSNVNVRFKQSWQGQYGNDNFVSIGQSYGDNFDDGKAVEYEFVDSTSGAGTYEIDYVSVYDKAGNSRFYYTSELVGLGFQTKFEIVDRKLGATAYTSTSGAISEGSGNSLVTTLTLQNVSTYSGTVTLAFDAANSTMTASEVNVPAFTGSYNVAKSPAGDYVITLPNIGVVDDLSIEGDETLAFRVTASGQIFSSGSDSSIIKVTVKDNDRAGTNGDDRMDGDAGNNYLLGLAGNDVINGFAGNDWLVGGDGHDQLNGGAGDDRLEPGAGNNIVDGGEGIDTLILSGAKSTYNFIAANGWTYLVGEEGASRVVNVERVSFAGETVAFETLATSLAAFDGLRYAASSADLLKAFGTDAHAAALHYVSSGFAEGRDAKSFDGLQYTASYADLSAAFGTNIQAATQHYIQAGFAEGRSADSFDGLRYIASNADLITAFGNDDDMAAWHYIAAGRAEGRSADSFHALQYAASYADLAAAFGTDTQAATRHYIQAGFAEGRSADTFDGLRYVASNADLITAFGDDDDMAAWHYLAAGRAEGRSLDSFHALQYAASYADLAAAFGTDTQAATRHYIDAGFAEGRSADSFDGLRYVASNPDLIVAIGDDDDMAAWHYVAAGRTEGRQLYAFDAMAYASANPDLAAAFGTDTHALTEHYIQSGYFEHRNINSSSMFMT